MPRDAELKVCNRNVLELCNKAAEGVYYHGKCHGKKTPSYFQEVISIHICDHLERDTVWIAETE